MAATRTCSQGLGQALVAAGASGALLLYSTAHQPWSSGHRGDESPIAASFALCIAMRFIADLCRLWRSPIAVEGAVCYTHGSHCAVCVAGRDVIHRGPAYRQLLHGARAASHPMARKCSNPGA